MRQKIILLIIFLLSLGIETSASAADALFYKELNLIGGYSDQEDWIGKSSSLSNSLGFEHFKKFSNEYGDYMTTDLQVRLAYDSIEDTHDAWAYEIHNAWLQYKLGYGLKLKIGHFDPAFGLEPIIDTHGMILQTLAPRSIGFKKDWGVGLSGILGEFDYETALQIGSGMSVRRKDGSFLVTARIGSPTSKDLQYGLSILYGEVSKSSGMETIPANDLLLSDAITKKRIGVDCQHNWRSFLFKGEAAYGADDNEEVAGGLLEADYTLPTNQSWSAKLQLQSWDHDIGKADDDDTTVSTSISYKLNQKITLRAAFLHDLNMKDGNEDDTVLVQFYYYGL